MRSIYYFLTWLRRISTYQYIVLILLFSAACQVSHDEEPTNDTEKDTVSNLEILQANVLLGDLNKGEIDSVEFIFNEPVELKLYMVF